MTNLAAAGAAIMAEEHALEEAMHVAAVKVGRAGRAFGAENPAEYFFSRMVYPRKSWKIWEEI